MSEPARRPGRRLLGSVWLLALPLAACAAGPHRSPAPTTTPSGNAMIVRLADAVPLQRLLPEDWSPNLTDKLDTPATGRTTYFGELDTYDEDADDTAKPIDAVPIIARKDDTGAWSAVALLGPGLKQAGWRYVAAGPRPKESWGALDTVTDADHGSFVLAHSTDGGETFHLQVLHKPCKLAAFYDFLMSRDGRGRASVSLDTDCGPHKAGVYHYETTDGGRTWSTVPRFEPDAMIRSDTVPDAEQPDTATATPQRSLWRGRVWQGLPTPRISRIR